MLNFLNNKKLVFPLLAILCILFFYIAYTADVTFDAGDGIRHYLVSRYSWKHPAQLLYSWGKPFFTIISSPFSQFGLIGVNAFNILCAAFSAWMCFGLAKKFKLQYPLLVIPFLFFTPCYFPTLNSGLTEPFFGFVLICSIFLFTEKKFFWGTVLISFLPFVRSEGNLLLPLFFIILLYRKKFWYSLLLAFGTVFYSIVGSFYYKDLFWVKNQNPYTGINSDLYGHGELLHFVNNHDFIWGTCLGVLFIIGCLAILFKLIPNKKQQEETPEESFLPEELILVYGSFILYFVAHSIFWWKGIVGSLGLLRVVAAVIPCSALICLRGFDLITKPLFKRLAFLQYIIIPVLLFFVVASPFQHDYYPYRPDQEQALVKEAGDWYKTTVFTSKKVYYLYPYFAHVLDVDPFDSKKVEELWSLYPTIKTWGIDAVPDSTIVIWDAHFGPNECRIPIDRMLNDPNFEFVKSFKPKEPFKVLGGYFFEIYVFMKTDPSRRPVSLRHELFDLEQNVGSVDNATTSSTEKAYSGKTSSKLSAKNEYSATIKKMADTLAVASKVKRIGFQAKISGDPDNYKDALMVASVDDKDGKSLYWTGLAIDATKISDTDTSSWKLTTANFLIGSDLLKNGNTLKLYIWNKAKKEFYVDDLEIDYLGPKQ
ncbi:MAG: hypothetical protein JWP12_2387 [Bacteroidetes bacterium]|nr:hypothetical protein [Bacteroidota bacterium]